VRRARSALHREQPPLAGDALELVTSANAGGLQVRRLSRTLRLVPDTRYASSGDVHVAYQVTGEGPTDMVMAPGTASHLDLDWEWPEKADFLNRLGSFCRLIRFDKRGTGLSDRPTDAATLEERTDDIRAVMDAAGSDRAYLFGYSEGANLAVLFGATYPQRALGLLLWGAQARWTRADDYPWGQTREEYDEEIAYLAENGVTLEYLTGAGAGVPKDLTSVKFFMRYAKASAGPAALAALERLCSLMDSRDILPSLRVPTLVMHRTGDPVANVEAGRDLASRIPDARFVEFPGDTHSFYGGPAIEEAIAEIETFVTGARLPPRTDRVLATVLFTDIVGSTERAVALGDRRWRDLLEAHDGVIRRELARFQGREVDAAGDGFLAVFDGPGRAVACASAIAEAVRSLGLEVRAGLHTGECELVDGKVRGIVIHTGARIAALAKPNEILVSGTVHDLVAGSELRFENRGTHTLRGVPGEWRVFSVITGPDSSKIPARPSPRRDSE
jgi:class 3 adenylate cyclase